MPRLLGIEQDSPEWIISRIGCVTASGLSNVVAKPKIGDRELKVRYHYRMEKVIERLMGRAANHKVNDAMLWGKSTQPRCKTKYELDNDLFVEAGGFWMHDMIPMFRASPDYLVGEDGLLECKCPFNQENHLEIFMKREIPDEWLWQVVAQLSVTNRAWCDFCSYDPRLPEDVQLAQIRVSRDEKLIGAMEAEVEQFLSEIEQTVKLLGQKSKAPAEEEDPEKYKQEIKKAEAMLAEMRGK